MAGAVLRQTWAREGVTVVRVRLLPPAPSAPTRSPDALPGDRARLRRYIVLPQRPAGTEDWTVEQLEGIITRDCLVGVTVPKAFSSSSFEKEDFRAGSSCPSS